MFLFYCLRYFRIKMKRKTATGSHITKDKHKIHKFLKFYPNPKRFLKHRDYLIFMNDIEQNYLKKISKKYQKYNKHMEQFILPIDGTADSMFLSNVIQEKIYFL